MTDIFDRAQELEEAERAGAVRRVVGELCGAGEDSCQRCGDEIEGERRLALPSATHCLTCQERLEWAARVGRKMGVS